MALPLKAAPGQTLVGRFHLLEEIGRGGMSTVFKANDLEHEGKLVAVKVPLPQYSSGMGSWSMFQREMEIGVALHHPRLVRFVLLTPNKQNLVVTELVAGVPLSARIGKGRFLREDEALSIASQVSDAVDYLHGRDIVHYDLKPANVMLCEDGTVRLIDFGLAHAVVRGRFTLAGPAPAVATAAYVAPEQIGRRRGQPSV
ncbi:MAG: serine/threonine-protein kinase, partial [Polyangiaceae bacterium]